MKVKYSLLCTLAVMVVCSSCNEEWKNEQFERYISFKAPINSEGVSRINVPYKTEESATYQVPLIVSGSVTNDRNYNVHIGLDPDTLDVLNYERFNNRKDLYYKVLDTRLYSFPETVQIKAGENTALLPVEFNLNGIDLTDKWVLPLTIEDAPDGSYTPNYRKHYRKALLRVMPFNDYSGNYSGVNYKSYIAGAESEGAIVKSLIMTYVVDHETVFFYAGTVDETRTDRKNYKIKARFTTEGGRNLVELTTENDKMKFRLNKAATFYAETTQDPLRPYLEHRTITIMDIDYNFVDYTTVPGAELEYHVVGDLTMERQVNTQIPDGDQSIEWE